jgi:hypothetical protein
MPNLDLMSPPANMVPACKPTSHILLGFGVLLLLAEVTAGLSCANAGVENKTAAKRAVQAKFKVIPLFIG